MPCRRQNEVYLTDIQIPKVKSLTILTFYLCVGFDIVLYSYLRSHLRGCEGFGGGIVIRKIGSFNCVLC